MIMTSMVFLHTIVSFYRTRVQWKLFIFLGIRTNRGEVLQFIRLIIGMKSKLYIYIIKLWNEIQLYDKINIKLEWNPSL